MDHFNISIIKSFSGMDVICARHCQIDGHNIVKCKSCEHKSGKF